MPISQNNPRIYLASRSPRRRELLTQIGVQFDTIILRNHPREEIDADELPLAFEAPVDYVERMARSKAEQGWRIVGWRKLLSQPLLAADTTVEFEGQIIGKPDDEEDAKSILRRLSDRTHRVLTAVALAFEGRIETALSVSEVSFGVIDEAEIRRYVLSGDPMDKAGAYGIQGRAGLYVKHLSGSYTGVMGLPLHETSALLRRIGYPL